MTIIPEDQQPGNTGSGRVSRDVMMAHERRPVSPVRPRPKNTPITRSGHLEILCNRERVWYHAKWYTKHLSGMERATA